MTFLGAASPRAEIAKGVLGRLRPGSTSNSTNRPSVPFFEKCVLLGYSQVLSLMPNNRRESKERKMKKIILLAGIMFLAASARAQIGGGTLGFSHPNLSSRVAAPSASQAQVNVSAKNPGEFVPSTFESYKEAVILGQEELDARPLTVAEAARIHQAARKSEIQKATLVAEQDDSGKMVIVMERQQEFEKSN